MIHSSEIWDPLRKKSVARTPEVELGQETVDQALRYNSVLDVKFINNAFAGVSGCMVHSLGYVSTLLNTAPYSAFGTSNSTYDMCISAPSIAIILMHFSMQV